VMEGCSKYCTYCVVPYTRGEEISRPLDDVIAEAWRLAELGVKEINLLGQNVNAYRGPTHDGRTADLATLIHYVAAIDGIERIRFTTSHPVEFTDSLIAAYAEVEKLASFLHLPVQSGSDRVLAPMKRGHTAAAYVEKIDRLKQARPATSSSSAFIVGFPRETERADAGAARVLALVRFHRRPAGRDGPRCRGHARADPPRRLRPVVHRHVRRAPRHPCRRDGGRVPPRGRTGASRAAAGARERAGGRDQPLDGRERAACARRAGVEEIGPGDRRAHREQPLGQFRRRSRARRRVRRRAHHRGHAEFPEGPPRGRDGAEIHCLKRRQPSIAPSFCSCPTTTAGSRT